MAKTTDTVQRQITFDSNLYQKISDAADDENKRLGLSLRSEKIHIQDIIPALVADGLAARNGKIYTPNGKTFLKDEKYLNLKAKAELAIENFLQYQAQLLQPAETT